jgi:hypothetical protein
MATIEQKIACEHRARQLVADAGLPAPDHTEYGFTCIWLLWTVSKLALRIDIDHEEDDLPVVLVDEPHPSQPPLAPEADLYPGSDYEPLVLLGAATTLN